MSGGYALNEDWVAQDGFTPEGFVDAAGHSVIAQRRNPKRAKKCKFNKDTCEGFRALGTEYCIGHAKHLGLVA